MQPGFDAKIVRQKVLQAERFSESKIHPYAVHPFDNQWCYHSLISPLWNRSKPELVEQLDSDSLFLIARMQVAKDVDGSPMTVVSGLFDDGLLNLHAVAFSFFLRDAPSGGLFSQEPRRRANLSARARVYLAGLGLPNPDDDPETAGLLWYHALAIGYSGQYQTENADGIGQDFPRIPLPASVETLRESAGLGQQVAALLVPNSDWKTAMDAPERAVSMIVFADAGIRDLGVAANWGYRTTDGKVMPGSGRAIRRAYTPAERETFGEAGLTALGQETYDVYLNNGTWFSNVPEYVWHYHIGGYQVLKKWLSYREVSVLGRVLTKEEVRERGSIARQLAALLLLRPVLDANYGLISTSSGQNTDAQG